MGEELAPVDKLHHKEQPLLGLEGVLQRCEERMIVGSEDLVLRHYLCHLTGEPISLENGRTAIEVEILSFLNIQMRCFETGKARMENVQEWYKPPC